MTKFDWENASDEDIAKHLETPAGQCESIESFLNNDSDRTLTPITWGELHSQIDAAAKTDPDHMKRPVDLADLFDASSHTMVKTDRGLESACYGA